LARSGLGGGDEVKGRRRVAEVLPHEGQQEQAERVGPVRLAEEVEAAQEPVITEQQVSGLDHVVQVLDRHRAGLPPREPPEPGLEDIAVPLYARIGIWEAAVAGADLLRAYTIRPVGIVPVRLTETPIMSLVPYLHQLLEVAREWSVESHETDDGYLDW
jgi:hypothetical protein